jgi:hypothetical protein
LNTERSVPLYPRHSNMNSAFNISYLSCLNILNGINGAHAPSLIPQLPYGILNNCIPSAIGLQTLQEREAKTQKLIDSTFEHTFNIKGKVKETVISADLRMHFLPAAVIPIEEKRHQVRIHEFTFPQTLYTQCYDEDNLSEFQCCIRKHIEMFEAIEEDVNSNAQGRHKVIVLGQVGIRCCHCAKLPPRCRMRGSTYYPSSLHGLYQAAQNMASIHFNHFCHLLPEKVQTELKETQGISKSNARGGKEYWARCLKARGLIELNGRIYADRK